MLKMIFSNATTGASRSAIFIDRDGVINQRRPNDYVLSWDQFVFVPGIRDALRQLGNLGLPMILISNQAAVGKGLLTSAGLEQITQQMRHTLLEDGTALAGAYYCPHRANEDCACRKPKAELLYRAAEDFNIDLGRSIFVGDSQTDVQAARAAGCVPVLFGSELCATSDSGAKMGLPYAPMARDLFAVVAKTLQIAQRLQAVDHVVRPSGA